MTKRANDFCRSLLTWYRRQRRDLPWRVRLDAPPGALPPPYHVLVSEAMLQQTQVRTVVDYFHRFIARFPTLPALADASEQQVLQLWQGLGYYSRARNLRATAKVVRDQFAGQIPSDVTQLMTLPGVGRYTAGAIASLAFDRPAPILDGNVARVLCRLDCIRDDPRTPAVREKLWDRAAQILPDAHCGDFNSAMMELGATVCTPRCPRCDACPVQRHCQAFADGVAEQIPPPAAAKSRPLARRCIICIRRKREWLIEQRPAKGRWAGLWQFVTLMAGDGPPTPADVLARCGARVSGLRQIGQITHDLTHRRYEFQVFCCEVRGRPGTRKAAASDTPRLWTTLAGLSAYPLPRPHVRAADILRDMAQRHRA
jgi:A/G-specific adenine glycosylase